ncbi:MAG: transglutaminase domain-containing protein [Lachnospiraceae bacterium]|nr:transglutaminase domain-containing protein [Lachnospiraceae bacterium]
MLEFIYDMLYIVPLAFTAMVYYCGLFGVEEKNFPMFIALLLPLTILSLFVQLKARGRFLLAGITAVACLGFYFVFAEFTKDHPIEEPERYIALLIISVAVFAVGMMMARVRIFRLIAAFLPVALLVLSLEVIRLPEGSETGIFSAMFLIILSVANEIQLRWKRHGDTNEKKHMVYTFEFIFVIVFAASLFKFPDKPYDWKAFINLWNGITVVFDRIKFNFGEGGDTMIGFSEEAGLKPHSEGNNDITLLEVEAPTAINVPIDLAGTIYDTFDGHQWSTTDVSVQNLRMMDSIESYMAARSGSEDVRDILRSETIYVKYIRSKSHYVFAPTKAPTVEADHGNVEFIENLGFLSFRNYNPYHIRVKEIFYKVNYDNPVFYEYMADKTSFSEENWQSLLRTFGLTSKADVYGYSKYLDYVENVKNIYSQDIEISPELRDKLDKIYEGADSDYEKLKRLEKTLSSMTYTTATQPIPDYVTDASDFLDYFLLESREGFCSHYATAFVLLARAEGLPARYVQGYRIAIDGSGTYRITPEKAHAWPEVYFESKGWITFEPTPGINREISWRTVATKIEKLEPNAPPPTVFDEPEEPAAEIEEIIEEEEEPSRINPFVILIPIGGVIAFTLLFMVIARAVSKRRFYRLEKEEKLRWLAKDIMSCLSLLGEEKDESETLREYTKRVAPVLGDKATDYAEIYERLIYSEFVMKQSDLNILYACHDEVLERLKAQNRVKYIFKTLLSQF